MAQQSQNSSTTGHVSAKRWQQLVRECRKAVQGQTQLQFQLGDAALEIEPMQTGSRSPNELEPRVREVLELFAEEIGIETDVMLQYRRVAAAWPKKQRHYDVPYTVHRDLATLPDRFKVIKKPPKNPRTGEYRWTCDAARRRSGKQVDYPREPHERLDRGSP